MMSIDIRARVFISCGQRADSGEAAVAAEIASVLSEAGFQPYVAIDHQSLRSIRENVFPQLRDSEYFLFLDFRRDGLLGSSSVEYRGSLFSHQELAIASYLDKEVLAFREAGVRPLDGLIGHLQTNCFEFDERSTLPGRVSEEIRRRGWRPNWQNRLTLSLASPPFNDALHLPDQVMGRFYHLRVANLHPTRTAQDCVAYLREVIDCKSNCRVPFETVEFKWAGYSWPEATIAPSSSRRLDAFWLPHYEPTKPRFNCFADSSHFVPHFGGVGGWELSFEVISSTIPSALAHFRLELRNQLKHTGVSEVDAV
jgi:hypothetical protein